MSEKTDIRGDYIMKALLLQGDISVDELVAQVGTSAPSVRRDLARLEKRGLIRRTHGGATLVEPLLYEPFRHDTSFQARELAIRRPEAPHWSGRGRVDPREGDYRPHRRYHHDAGWSLVASSPGYPRSSRMLSTCRSSAASGRHHGAEGLANRSRFPHHGVISFREGANDEDCCRRRFRHFEHTRHVIG